MQSQSSAHTLRHLFSLHFSFVFSATKLRYMQGQRIGQNTPFGHWENLRKETKPQLNWADHDTTTLLQNSILSPSHLHFLGHRATLNLKINLRVNSDPRQVNEWAKLHYSMAEKNAPIHQTAAQLSLRPAQPHASQIFISFPFFLLCFEKRHNYPHYYYDYLKRCLRSNKLKEILVQEIDDNEMGGFIKKIKIIRNF